MTTREQFTIQLPGERMVQLRQIADAKGLTLTELIGDFIRNEIKAKTIPDEVPGVSIVRSGDQVTMGFDGHPPVSIRKQSATVLAHRLSDLISAAPQRGAESKPGKAVRQFLHSQTVDHPAANTFSTALDDYANNHPGAKAISKAVSKMADDLPVRAERRGKGVKLEIGHVTKAFSTDVAKDIARLMKMAGSTSK